MEDRSNGTIKTSFNVNALVIGILAACVMSALGFSEGDPLIQWYMPGGILLLSIAYGKLRPTKRTVRSPQSHA